MSTCVEFLQYLKQYLDPLLIKEDISNFDRSIIQVELKKSFEGIDENDQSQLLFNLLLKKCIQISDNLEFSIQEGKKQIKELLDAVKDQQKTIFQVFYTLLTLFLKETWTGPSFLTTDSLRKMKLEKKTQNQVFQSKKYPTYDFSSVIAKYNLEKVIPADINTYNYKFIKTAYFLNRFDSTIISSLEVDSENWPRLLPLSHVFIVLVEIISYLNELDTQNPIYVLYLARVKFIHSQMLFLPTGTLYPQVVENYSKFFNLLKELQFKLPRQTLSNLYIENSHALLFYYKYSSSKKSLAVSQELLKIEFNLTGRMGKRTKYQTFNTCQLVVQAFDKEEGEETKPEVVDEEEIKIDKEELKMIEEEQKDSVDAKKLINEMQLNIAPQNIQLDEECVLLEKPVIDENDDFNKSDVVKKDEKSELNIYEQVLVLGIMKHHEIVNPHDDLYHEYIQAYCNLLIDRSLNWMVFSCGLLYRSVNEYIRFKKMERALLQMQTLVDQYNDALPTCYERIKYLFSLNYPHYFDLQKTLAEKYMKVGIVMSGCQIFERLGMHEECVECLQSAGHSDRAKKLAEQHLNVINYFQQKEIYFKIIQKQNPTPKLLCIYGELTKDIKYFKQAWKLSGKKFARAQRSLGRAYFYSNLFEKSIRAFKKAVSINRYNTAPWFTMGCAYIKINDLQNATNCFSTVVSINESDGESWANLSSCLMKLGKKSEALSTLEQATKFCERNWRIWENLLYISLSNQKFYKYFECIEKLAGLNQKSVIDEETVAKVVQIFKFQMSKYHTTDYKYQFFTYRNRIERLFNFLQKEIGEKHYVWKYWAEFKEIEIDFEELQTLYLIEMRKIRKAEKEQGIVNSKHSNSYFGEDPEWEEKELQEDFEMKKVQLLNKIADLRMKTCQVIQIAGWQIEKKQCELLYEHTKFLVEAYKKINNEDKNKELDMFIKSIKNTIEQALEKQVQFNQ
ncbi:hypothetical protein ABPG74_011371 [Tetrahymena malaccensis]